MNRLRKLLEIVCPPRWLFATFVVMTLIAPVGHAANGAWTTIYSNTGTRTTLYGISTTVPLFTPAITLPKMGTNALAVLVTASATAVITPRGVLSPSSLNDTTAVTANDPSGTLNIGSLTVGATGSNTTIISDSMVKGLGFYISPTAPGVLTSIYLQVIAPASVK